MSGTSLSSLFSFSWVSLEAPRQKQWQNRRVYPGLWMPQMKNKAGGKPRVHQEQCVSGANLEREERDKSTSLQVLFLISCWVVSDSLWPCGLQHTRLPCPSLSPGVCSNSCPLGQWCHPTISSSVASFSFCHWSFPASGSFPVSLPFPSGITCLEILTLCNPPSSPPWYYCCWTPFIATDYFVYLPSLSPSSHLPPPPDPAACTLSNSHSFLPHNRQSNIFSGLGIIIKNVVFCENLHIFRKMWRTSSRATVICNVTPMR